jgi:hypothetical protein
LYLFVIDDEYENRPQDHRISPTVGGQPRPLASAITYLPYGGIKGLIYGNNLSLTQEYDNQYRISSILTDSILNLTHGYDPNGNITSILDTVNPPGGEVLETTGLYTYQPGTNKLAQGSQWKPMGSPIKRHLSREKSIPPVRGVSSSSSVARIGVGETNQ